MANVPDDETEALRKLRRGWGQDALLAVMFLLAGYGLLYFTWQPVAAGVWLLAAGLVGGYQFAFLWRKLPENRPDLGGKLYLTFGPANQITIARGIFFAALAGFLLLPKPPGLLAWLPGGLYLSAALLDFADGYAARVTRRVSRLGGILDMEWDSIGFLLVVLIAIRYGQISGWYLLLGLARYLFIFGIAIRQKRGLPIYELDHSMIRRALAGAQMGFTAVVLLPVFGPPATQVAAILFLIPSLAHFWRDWLFVCGLIGPAQPRTGIVTRVRLWLPLVARAVLVGLLLLAVWRELALHPLRIPILLAMGLGLLALAIGAAGRLAALGMLLLSAFLLKQNLPDLLYWLILFNSTLVFLAGTGRLSLWTPENWLIYHRAGEV